MASGRRVGSREVPLLPGREEAQVRAARPDLLRDGAPALDPEVLQGLAKDLERMGQGAASGAASVARFGEFPSFQTNSQRAARADLKGHIQDLIQYFGRVVGTAKKTNSDSTASSGILAELKKIYGRVDSKEAGFGPAEVSTAILAAMLRRGALDSTILTEEPIAGTDWSSRGLYDRLESVAQMAGAVLARTREAQAALARSEGGAASYQQALVQDEMLYRILVEQVEALQETLSGDASIDEIDKQAAAIFDGLRRLDTAEARLMMVVLTPSSEQSTEILASINRRPEENTQYIGQLHICRVLAARDLAAPDEADALALVQETLADAARMIEDGVPVPNGHFRSAIKAARKHDAYALAEALEEMAALLK